MKISKRFVLLLLVVCFLCGCSSDKQTNSTAAPAEKVCTITITDSNGTPVPNVILQYEADYSSQLAVTNSEGKVTFTSKTGITALTLNAIPEGYTVDTLNYSFDGKTAVTILLTANQDNPNAGVTYTVHVVDQDGNPVSGVVLQFCDEENCKLPVSTDENGNVSQNFAESEYHVTLNTIPEGYTSAATEFYFNGGTEMTIILTAENGE